MTDRPLRYRSRLFVRDQGTPLGAVAFEKSEDTMADADGFTDSFQLALPSCAGCLAVMHSPEEVGGACGHCRTLVCKGCAERRCEIDGLIVCRQHSDEVRGHIVCSDHGLLELLLLLVRHVQ